MKQEQERSFRVGTCNMGFIPSLTAFWKGSAHQFRSISLPHRCQKLVQPGWGRYPPSARSLLFVYISQGKLDCLVVWFTGGFVLYSVTQQRSLGPNLLSPGISSNKRWGAKNTSHLKVNLLLDSNKSLLIYMEMRYKDPSNSYFLILNSSSNNILCINSLV